MISIQTNVNSLVAQQNLSVNSAFQSKTIQQLTSGYRINQSGDDAAGLAVANKFRSTIAELTQGVANGNDATAQLQIMDGGQNNIRRRAGQRRPRPRRSPRLPRAAPRAVARHVPPALQRDLYKSIDICHRLRRRI